NLTQKEKVTIELIESESSKKSKSMNEKKLQIVDQDKKPLNNEVDENAELLSQHNQRVKQQTRAAHIGKFKNSNGANGSESQAQMQPQKKPQPQSRPQLTGLQHFAPKLDFDKLSLDQMNSQNQAAQNARPSKSGDLSSTDDHLKNIPIGMETILSTKEFLYYSYFNRIKDKIRKRWGSKVRQKVEKMVRSGRHLASTQDRVTKIIITLNSSGVLERVQVLHQSGLRDLDDAAIEAFKEAAPFPNPPKGLKDKDGKVRINWDFILEASRWFNNSTKFASIEG
ncbi:MAG: energy transducer TonB, partial [Bdellovibrionales bacterium]|nr:energy transducer TonB [Bdellovibrionales bacterium]